MDQQTNAQGANPRDIKITVYEAHQRLSKRYSLASDGKSVIKESFTQLYEGGYRVVTVPAGDIPAALQACGIIFDALTYKQAISLGVPRDGSTAGLITTKGKVRDGTAPAVAIPRDLEHFGWPELALLFLDGDDRDGLYELLCGLYPALAKVAALVRPSVSACVAHPVTGKALKTGEHVYLVIDKPERSRDCLHAIMRLAWVHGKGAAAGWLALSMRGDVLIRGPIDAVVGRPERLSYEGAGKLEAWTQGVAAGLSRDRRQRHGRCGRSHRVRRSACTGTAVPRMVDAAKNDPAFIAACAAVKADYRATHIKKGAAQRLKKDPSLTPEAAEAQATESFDATEAAGTCDADGRVWIPPGGRPCFVLSRRQGIHGRGHQGRPGAVQRQGMLRSGRGDGLPIAQLCGYLHQLRRPNSDLLQGARRRVCLCRVARLDPVGRAAGTGHGGARHLAGGRDRGRGGIGRHRR